MNDDRRKPDGAKLFELVQRFLPLFHGGLLSAFRPDVREELGLSKSQVHALMVVRRKQRITATSMGTCMGMTKANMTVLVDELEGAGLVRRTRLADDRRKTLIELSPGGAEAADRVEALIRANLDELLGTLGPERATRLEEGLSGAIAALEKTGEN